MSDKKTVSDRTTGGIIPPDEKRGKRLQHLRALAIVAIGVALAVSIAVFVDMKKRRMREADERRHREAMERVTYPEEMAVLAKYAAVITAGLPEVSCSPHPPTVIVVRNHPLLKEVGVFLDPLSKKIRSISIKIDISFTASSYRSFGELFVQSPFGGGKTAEGKTIEPTRAAIRPSGTIDHEDFSITFSDYHDPIQSLDPLMKRPARKPAFDPTTGRIIGEGSSRQPVIIDEDEPADAKKTVEMKPPEVIARQITITMKADRNSLAQEVFTKTITSLLGTAR